MRSNKGLHLNQMKNMDPLRSPLTHSHWLIQIFLISRRFRFSRSFSLASHSTVSFAPVFLHILIKQNYATKLRFVLFLIIPAFLWKVKACVPSFRKFPYIFTNPTQKDSPCSFRRWHGFLSPNFSSVPYNISIILSRNFSQRLVKSHKLCYTIK